MRLIVLLLVGIALPNVYMKYLLLSIDGDETPDDRNGDMKNGNNNVDEETGETSRDYTSNYTIIFRLLGQ